MQPATMDRQRLLDRFLRYVRIGTTANPQSLEYPSSPGQWTLGKLLVDELQAMGIADAHQDQHGLVWAKLPASSAEYRTTMLLNAHLDTSPEAPGEPCNPQVIDRFQGDRIQLLSGEAIDGESTPELAKLQGHTLITTDGRTLLGADDKAGVAVIMECVQFWLENPDQIHGPIQVVFTCDEEIGMGTKHLNVQQTGAIVGYTLDGGGAGTIDEETFSADGAVIKFQGRNTHPSVGKGKMINAVRAAGRFLSLLPTDRLSPETTSDREGFIHPHTIQGGVASTTIHFILRDFDTEILPDYADLLRNTAQQVEREFAGLSIEVEIVKQYRNMADALLSFPKAIELAEQAYRDLGMEYRRDSIRGGTDGALMSAMGLPTPNLSVGQYNIHSVREFASLNEMLQAAQHTIRLAELWASFKE